MLWPSARRAGGSGRVVLSGRRSGRMHALDGARFRTLEGGGVKAQELDRLCELITVDCYNEEERMTAFLQVFQEEVSLPVDALLVAAAFRSSTSICGRTAVR